MSSPKIVTFALFNITTGAPLTGQAPSMSFTTYKNETGTDLTPPAIVEIGNGLYYFTPIFTAGHGIAYILNTGSGANPTGLSGYLRPEDFNTDNIDVASSTLQTAIANVASIVAILRQVAIGKAQLFTTGPDANKIVFYDTDNTTVIAKLALFDANGVPTTTNPFSHTPTS